MSKALTDIAIRNIKPRKTRMEIPDAKAHGLYLIVQPSGRKTFAVRYRIHGQPKKLTLQAGIELAAARKAAAAAMYEVEQGNDPAEQKKAHGAKAARAQAETVEAICEDYLKRDGAKLRTVDERKYTFKRLIYPAIGSIPVSAIKRSQINKMLDTIQDNSGDRTADLALAYLRKAFNWYATRDDDFRSPIVKGMGRYNPKANNGKHILSDDEVRSLWKATEPNDKAPNIFHALIRFLLLTAARRTEAGDLPWAELKGGDWHLPAKRNKANFDLTRPLSKAALAVLASVPRINGGQLVFSNDGATPISLSKPFAKFINTCGVTDWTLHDLRGTARTLMSRAGVNADTAERCLGHVIGGVRGVYDQHKYHAEMSHAFDALAAQIQQIVNPPSGDVVTPIRKRRRA
jgi:integrase